jgi:aminopeptidase
MADTRIERLAQVMVDYSLEIRAGDLFLISGEVCAEPLVREVYRLAVRKGAHPVLQLSLPGLTEIYFKEAPDESLDSLPPLALYEVEQANAYLEIMGGSNTQELSGVDPARMARASRARAPIIQRFMQRAISEGRELRWCATLFPTYSAAQDAHMSLADYEAFVYHAMMLDTPDPVIAWQEMSARQAGYCERLHQHDEIHIVAEDTDLRLRTRGRRWINADGRLNFPDGEVFTGPLEDSVEGYIRYPYPTVHAGREAEDVRLWFEKGEVVRWEARQGKELLDELFAMDPGARRLGEFAIGTNNAVPTFTKNVLFDEKIGGTCHLAVGASIPITGGQVQSSLHWDMICDLRRGGAIYADGDLIHENGEWKI